MSTGFTTGRALRPTTKVLPEHARGHNRSLVLQTLYRSGTLSRADLARSTGLTRVTISDLVADLMDEKLVVEVGQRDGSRPGKPATMLDINRGGFQIIGIDLSDYAVFRGAVLDLDGVIADVALDRAGLASVLDVRLELGLMAVILSVMFRVAQRRQADPDGLLVQRSSAKSAGTGRPDGYLLASPCW